MLRSNFFSSTALFILRTQISLSFSSRNKNESCCRKASLLYRLSRGMCHSYLALYTLALATHLFQLWCYFDCVCRFLLSTPPLGLKSAVFVVEQSVFMGVKWEVGIVGLPLFAAERFYGNRSFPNLLANSEELARLGALHYAVLQVTWLLGSENVWART